MYKKGLLLLTFLAYSLTLVHSLVPHHHHDDPSIVHDHGNSEHHHDDHNDDHDKSINHAFADAVHNPASEVFVSAQEYTDIQKKSNADTMLIVKLNQLLVPELKPPDWTFTYQEKYHSSDPYSFFLLRAPPVA